MSKLTGWVRQAAFVVSAMVLSVGASAQVTWTVVNGEVTGAQNVYVSGSFYDVVFSEVWVDPQPFVTQQFAASASVALYEQVFVASAPLDLDATPIASAGCEEIGFCFYVTIYNTTAGYLSWTQTINFEGSRADFAVDHNVNTDRTSLDIFSSPSFTGAVWTPVAAVPEPETYALMLAGLGLMGAVARRRKAKQA